MTVSISRPVPVSFPPTPVRNTSQSFADGTLAFAGKLEIEHCWVCFFGFFLPLTVKNILLGGRQITTTGGLFADAQLKHVTRGVIGINSTQTERRQPWSQSAASWASKFLLCVCVRVVCVNTAVRVSVDAQREGSARAMRGPVHLLR